MTKLGTEDDSSFNEIFGHKDLIPRTPPRAPPSAIPSHNEEEVDKNKNSSSNDDDDDDDDDENAAEIDVFIEDKMLTIACADLFEAMAQQQRSLAARLRASRPCDRFLVDVRGDNHLRCRCGHSKAAHLQRRSGPDELQVFVVERTSKRSSISW